MGSRRLPRLAAACVAVGVLSLSAPAWADSTISINPGNLNGKPASKWPTQECSAQLGGAARADQDIWVFNLPGKESDTGGFKSLTITFTTPSGEVVRNIPGPDSGIEVVGHSKAWIAVPEGWILKAATAVVGKTAAKFVLTHTCPARDSGNPPGGNPPGGNPPGDNPPGGNPPGNNPPGDGGSGGSGGGLPVTGAAVTGIVATGLLITSAGAALVYFQRRRRINVDDIS